MTRLFLKKKKKNRMRWPLNRIIGGKMAKAKKITGRGGAGRGQGRKLKYSEPTTVIRVPISLLPEIEKLLLKKAKNENNKLS
jgi:hypothetical protein